MSPPPGCDSFPDLFLRGLWILCEDVEAPCAYCAGASDAYAEGEGFVCFVCFWGPVRIPVVAKELADLLEALDEVR